MFLVEVFGMPPVWPGSDSEDLEQLLAGTIPELFAARYGGDGFVHVNVHHVTAHAMATLRLRKEPESSKGACVLVTVRPMGVGVISTNTRNTLIQQLADAVGGFVFTRASDAFGAIAVVNTHLDSENYRAAGACRREAFLSLVRITEASEPRAA